MNPKGVIGEIINTLGLPIIRFVLSLIYRYSIEIKIDASKNDMLKIIMNIQCRECNASVRKDTIVTHIHTYHPQYLWDTTFNFTLDTEKDDAYIDIRRKLQLSEHISLLECSSPYELDNECYIDFADKTSYSTAKTAQKHIDRHPQLHRDNYMKFMRESMNPVALLNLAKWAIKKPVRIIMDEVELCKRVRENTQIERLKLQVELIELAKKTEKCNTYLSSDIIMENINHHYTISEQRETIKQQQDDYRRIQEEIVEVKQKAVREVNHTKDGEYLMCIELARSDCEKKIKKTETACDTKVKKLKEKIEEQTEQSDKIIKKLKKTIKKLEAELKLLQIKDSDSDSDSDDE